MTNAELNSWQLAAIEGNTRVAAKASIATAQASMAAAAAAQENVAQVAALRAELSQDFAELNSAVSGIEDQNREIANLHMEGIELQQEALRREDFQNRMEELIYQFQKLLKKLDDPKSDFPVSTKYYLAVGILQTVQGQQLSTVLIKGRDNKAAFEQCTERASSIYKQLQNHAEVKKAIEWAAAQEARRRAEEAKRRAEEEAKEAKRRAEEKEEAIRARMRELKDAIVKTTFKTWFTKKIGMGVGVSWFVVLFLSLSCGCLGLLGQSVGVILFSLFCLLLMGGLAALPIVIYSSKKERIDEELNADTYDELDKLKAKLAKLRRSEAEDQPAGPKPRELMTSLEAIPSVEALPASLPPPLTIQFNCPTCKRTLKAPADKAGVKVSCPGCKATLQIP